MRVLIIAMLLLITGCGFTRTAVTPDGGCTSSTMTIGKDVSGGRFKGCGAEWGVDSSDPNAAMANNMMGTLNLLLPYALKAAATAP